MIPKIIIGVGHRSGVGKDTLCKFLDSQIRVKKPGVVSKKASFAWKLKEIAYDLYHWAGVQRPIYYETNREAREIPLEAFGGITVVDLWVKLGTDAIRDNVYERTWIDYLLKGQHTHVDILIIPDVRFPNEATAIRELGGYLLRVDNPNVPHRVGHSVDGELSGWTDWDAIFTNSEDLKAVMTYAGEVADMALERLAK